MTMIKAQTDNIIYMIIIDLNHILWYDDSYKSRVALYIISAIQAVSICVISVRMKAISLRAFSNIIFGSLDMQRKQFGANTIAKLDESILVLATISGWANICRNRTK